MGEYNIFSLDQRESEYFQTVLVPYYSSYVNASHNT